MQLLKKHRNLIPFIVATLAVVYLMPREGKFQYEFHRGKTWQYSTCIAPFDFPIYKSATELAAERSHTLATLTPFYKRDSNVYRMQAVEMEAKFRATLNKGHYYDANGASSMDYSRLLYYILPKLQQQVEFIYSKGIREHNAIAEGYLSHEHATLVVQSGALATSVPVEECFTAQSAYQYLSNRLQSLWKEGSKEQRFFTSLDVQSFLKPNLMFDERLTAQSRQQRLSSISPTKGMVSAGQQIVAQDEVISASTFQVLSSLKQEYEQRMGYAGSTWLLLLGQLLLTLFFMSALYLYIYFLGGKNPLNFKKNCFLMLLLLSFFAITLWVSKAHVAYIYIVPFAIVPIFVSTFFDSRLALFTLVVVALLSALIVPNSFEFFLLTCIAGAASILNTRYNYQRGKLYRTMAIVFATYSLLYMSLTLTKDGSIFETWRTYCWFAANVMLILASYQLVYLFEKVFGFTSDSTLMELSDTNHSLLRELSEIAPASFQHSLQVANLAESVIREIGGNPLLVRAGALYHDVGKMNNPVYFVENQAAGFTPHEQLEPEESAAIIIRHVTDGVAIARKYRLPEVIVQFIRTHHGTSLVRYFFRTYKEKYPDATDFSAFKYPGPNPSTKEQGVLMMADAVEAASRTLSSYAPSAIDELVENVITSQLNGKMLDNTDLTLNDINTAKTLFKRKLQNIYHDRVGAEL